MPIQPNTYAAIRALLKPGDVFAFGGDTDFSGMVKTATNSTVSHVAIVQAAAAGAQDAMLIEATVRETHDKKTLAAWKVAPEPCEGVVTNYAGNVWWLPLDRTKGQFDQIALLSFLHDMEGRPFDVLGGGGVLLNSHWRKLFDLDIFDNDDDLKLLFCSELVAAALQKAKMIDAAINPSDMSPADVCGWSIYSDPGFHLKGAAANIPRWNTNAPLPGNSTRRNLIAAFIKRKTIKLDPKLAAIGNKATKLNQLLHQLVTV